MAKKRYFEIGEIVTLKSHSLFNDYFVQGDGRYLPPIMMIKEVFFESNEKKMFDEQKGRQIADNIKYTCVFFNDNTSEFKEVVIYHSFLKSFTDLKYYKISNGEIFENSEDLISEVSAYPIPKYKYGKEVLFKTLKLEMFKKRKSRDKLKIKDDGTMSKDGCDESTIRYIVSFTSPNFLLSGFKKNEKTELKYPNGDNKLLVSKELFKVIWYNPFKFKFSEQYLPKEFLVSKDKVPFN